MDQAVEIIELCCRKNGPFLPSLRPSGCAAIGALRCDRKAAISPRGTRSNEQIPWAYWRRVGFGSDGTQRAIPSSVSNPRSIGELVELTKSAYPELFPRSVEAETAVVRFLYRVGRIVRLVQLQIRSQWASIGRALRILRRMYASFFRPGE
jgi:hypothetical protein